MLNLLKIATMFFKTMSSILISCGLCCCSKEDEQIFNLKAKSVVIWNKIRLSL